MFFLKFVSFLLVYVSWTYADVKLTVTGANVEKAKIAIGKVHALPQATKTDPILAQNLAKQVRSDLEWLNLFNFADNASFQNLDTPTFPSTIQYESWSPISASFYLKMGYQIEGSMLVLEALFYDIPGKRRIFGNRYQYPVFQYTRLVHALSEDILKQLTGEHGLFFSRIVMACTDLQLRRSPPREIFIMDADGENPTPLTADKTISLSPSWSPDGKKILYTQFDYLLGTRREKATVLKVHDLATGNRKVLSSRKGMNSGGAWSPDGKKIALTLSVTGRPELYLIDPSGQGEPEPISRKSDTPTGLSNLLMDVEPNWSPDGKQLTFSSARTGHPMIYVMDLATRAPRQVTLVGQYNASPAWSPKGDRILFSAQQTGESNFDIYSVDPSGLPMERLTAGDRAGKRIHSENATWSPTGRHFAFASNENGHYAIYAMTIDGTQRRQLSPRGFDCKNPSWGPAEN